MKSTILESVLNFDIYGTEPKLKIKGLDAFSTRLGKFLSYGSLILLLVASGYFGLSLWDYENPQLTHSERNEFNPQQVNFTEENFGFAFGLEDPISYNMFMDESIYRPEVYQMIGQRGIDGVINWETFELQLEPCSISKFPAAYRKIMSGVTDEMYCLKKPSFSLFGTFLNPSYSYVMIKLFECRNSTSKIPCKDRSIIDYYLRGTFFTFAHTDVTIDPTNYTEPDRKYAGDSYTTVSNKFYKEMHHFEKVIYMNTDQGWFTSDMQSKQYMQTDFIKEMIDFREKEEFMSYTFKLSTKIEIYGRTYAKIQDVIALIGGLIQFVVVFCQILIYNYNNSKLNETMANELFFVTEDSVDQSILIKKNSVKEVSRELITRISHNNTNEKDKFFNTHNSIGIGFNGLSKIKNSNKNSLMTNKKESKDTREFKEPIEKPASTKLPFVNQPPRRINNSSTSCLSSVMDSKHYNSLSNLLLKNSCYFDLPFCKSFWNLMFPCFYKDKKMKLLRKAFQEIDIRTDIITLLRDIRDIKRIKYLLFDKGQSKLLELPHKSLIKEEDNAKIETRESLCKEDMQVDNEQSKSKYREIQEAYYTVKNSAKSNRVNGKLMKILNDQYKVFIENNLLL